LADIDAASEVNYDIAKDRHVWVQVLRGSVKANGLELSAGDAIAVSDENRLSFAGSTNAEIMLFDLA
jgi:redox-sensitive bicupin YhaK (pirin superfamily)